MIRHSQNQNLNLSYQSAYQGLLVYTERGPLIAEYLERSKQVIDLALQQYGRVFAFRLDLRFPSSQDQLCLDDNMILERFIASFKAKIRHNRNKAREANPHAHDTIVRYLWCKEFGQHGVPHYHMVILLNHDAFCTLGKFELNRGNLFNRLHEAWASALGIAVESVTGLIELPKNPFYVLRKGDPESIAAFFYRVSYLCKAETKVFGDGGHAFGGSRI